MNSFLILIILILACVLVLTIRENQRLKKERDYYHEVDEENERLRKKISTES